MGFTSREIRVKRHLLITLLCECIWFSYLIHMSCWARAVSGVQGTTVILLLRTMGTEPYHYHSAFQAIPGNDQNASPANQTTTGVSSIGQVS